MFRKRNPIATITFLLLAISMFTLNMLYAQSIVIEESAKLLASDGARDDIFGRTVGISGDTMVIGAVGGDDLGSTSGLAYLYERNQGGTENWGQVTKLLASDGEEGDFFGSVAISGNTMVVGANLDNDNGFDSGSAYIFDRDQEGINNWGQVTKLLASDGAVEDFFGFEVAISGDTVIIGAQNDDDNGINSGSSYIFSLTADSINEEGPSSPSITTQPASQEVASGTPASLSVAANGDDLTYQWYTGNSGDTTAPVAGATGSILDTGALTANTNFWVQITNAGGTADSNTAVVTVAAPSIPLVLDGTGDIAGENIQHPNGNVFDQILLTGESIQLQARPNQITRVSFMDETEDIVQVEFSGVGSFTVTLDPATFLPPAIPPRYNQAVDYVTGKPSVVIDGADSNTFFSIFTVGSINAVNQALFP